MWRYLSPLTQGSRPGWQIIASLRDEPARWVLFTAQIVLSYKSCCVCTAVGPLCSLTLCFITELPFGLPLFQSDMYSLGVILLELFQPFGTEMERAQVLTGVRTGQVPESLGKRCPVQTKYIRQLTRKNASQRPSALQLLQSELFQNSGSVCTLFLMLGKIRSLK